MLLLDTNALLWALQDNPRLSPTAREMIDEGWAVGSVAVSVVTFWEIAVLAEKRKLLLGCDPARWRSDRIEGGLRELPLHGPEAVRAVCGVQVSRCWARCCWPSVQSARRSHQLHGGPGRLMGSGGEPRWPCSWA